MATHSLGHLRLRFAGDSADATLEIASAVEPDRYYRFADVEVAMGWRSLAGILGEQAPEPLDRLVERFMLHAPRLDVAFSAQKMPYTRKRIERVAQARAGVRD